jgi:hypothetical protein
LFVSLPLLPQFGGKKHAVGRLTQNDQFIIIISLSPL